MPKIQEPEWIDFHSTTKYPFSDEATLQNVAGDILFEGTFLDAIFYPIGNTGNLYLTQVDIDHSSVSLYVGTPREGNLAVGVFDLLNPPDEIRFKDNLDRPAGLIVSTTERLAIFQSWSVGTHTFLRSQTPFSATVSVPTPEIGLRGIVLEDGTLFTGDIWIVGEDGVVVRSETVTVPTDDCDGGKTLDLPVIRVDIVGDPLFRRRLCDPNNLFVTPNFIRQITFLKGNQRYICSPDDFGDIKIFVGNSLAEDTVLRIRTTEDGLVFESVGGELTL